MKTETKFTNLHDLREYFRSEETCRKYLEKQRWIDGKPICPFCFSDKVYTLSDNKTYKCANNDCYRKFTVTVGTLFENTKIPLSKWFVAMYIITSHTKGISSVQLSKDIGVTQKTAWFINHRIRVMLQDKTPQLLENMVEVDETYVGGKEKNKHRSKKLYKSRQTRYGEKTVMLGILERGKKVIAQKVENNKAKTLIPIINKKVKDGSVVITDEYSVYYNNLKNYYHFKVKHEYEQYAYKSIHTNSIEGFWSIFKRGIIGIYHRVSPKHIDRYLDEFTARYNNRKVSEVERFNLFLENCEGRLKYNDLIKKVAC